MSSIVEISSVGSLSSSANVRPSEGLADSSAVTSFRAAMSAPDGTSDTSSAGIFEVVEATSQGLRKDRKHVDAAFKNAVDTLDPWEMDKAAEAMSEYSHATQLATKLLNHAAQSVDQLTRGS